MDDACAYEMQVQIAMLNIEVLQTSSFLQMHRHSDPLLPHETSYAHAHECLDDACAYEMQVPIAMLNSRVL